MNILFMQTADTIRYRRMLALTSRTVLEYCGRHNCQYESFLGLKRGYHPWHATFNRIPMLAELVASGFSGWVIYMDADAYLISLDFDIRAYLIDKSQFAFIAAPDGFSPPLWSRINAGIFAINLDHPGGKRIVQGWHDAFMTITDEQLQAATHWDMATNDQILLQEFLLQTPSLQESCLTDSSVCRVMNYQTAQFIRQMLRSSAQDGFEQRLRLIEKEIETALGADFAAKSTVNSSFTRDAKLLHEDFVDALYKGLLLRAPDPDGLANALRKLDNPEHSFVAEMRSCLQSEAFRDNILNFLERYMPADQLRKLAGTLGEKYPTAPADCPQTLESD